MVNNIYGLTAHPFVSMSTDDASPTFLLLSINVTQPFSVGLYNGSDAEKFGVNNLQGKKNPGTDRHAVESFLRQVKQAKEMKIDRFPFHSASPCQLINKHS